MMFKEKLGLRIGHAVFAKALPAPTWFVVFLAMFCSGVGELIGESSRSPSADNFVMLFGIRRRHYATQNFIWAGGYIFFNNNSQKCGFLRIQEFNQIRLISLRNKNVYYSYLSAVSINIIFYRSFLVCVFFSSATVFFSVINQL